MAGKGNPAKTAENRYKTKRREMGWSREAAAFELHMSDDKLERIENGKQRPTPKDVLDMSDAYNSPELCNYFCNRSCWNHIQLISAIHAEKITIVNGITTLQTIHKLSSFNL